MKINMHEFNDHVGALANGDPEARRKAVSGLARYSGPEWEGSPDVVTTAVEALVAAVARKGAGAADAPFRAEAAKALGNIGTKSPAVVPELVRLLKEDADVEVRTEAARALGKIGAEAGLASKALAAILKGSGGGDTLRGEAARALARVDPLAPGTAAALNAAVDDRSGHVGVCAAEALWKVSGEPDRAVPALVARLRDSGSRAAAAQALYRIGPKAKAAVPALLTAAKDKDRLFHESVVMALRKIDPQAAAKAGVE